MAFGRGGFGWELTRVVTCAAAVLVGCGSSGDPMGGTGSDGSSGLPGAPETSGDAGTGDLPTATSGDDTSAAGDASSSGSSGEPAPQCVEDEDCKSGSACINDRCCYAVAWDGSCCESGSCLPPGNCGNGLACASNEVCEVDSCVAAPLIEPCEDPSLSPISLPIPGLGDAVVLAFAESDGSQGAELVAVGGSTVRVADAILSGIPSITTVEVPGKEDLVGVVAADLDADGLDELVVVDAVGTVTLLHALGGSAYEAVQAIGSSLRPPLQIADLDGGGPALIGLSDEGYTTFAFEGVGLDNVGQTGPKEVSAGASDLASGSLFGAAGLAASDGGGVDLVSSPGVMLRVVYLGSSKRVAIRDIDGDGLSELVVSFPGPKDTTDTVVANWSQEALAAEDAEATTQVLPLLVGAQVWGNIDDDAAFEWIVASPTAVRVVQFGTATCHQSLALQTSTDLLAAGDVDADGRDEVVVRGASGLVLLDLSAG